MFLALRLLGAEVMAVEFGRTPGEEKPVVEGGPGGVIEYGFHHAESDVILDQSRRDRQCH